MTFTIQRKQYVCWSDQSNHRVGTQQESGSEMSFVEEFRNLDVMTADCLDDEDIEKQFWRQNAVGNILVRKFSFAPIGGKNPIVQVILLPYLRMCSLASFV